MPVRTQRRYVSIQTVSGGTIFRTVARSGDPA
jgi:hypothetical protein